MIHNIYIAGPLYTPHERSYLEEIDLLCKNLGCNTYLPHRDGGLAPGDGSNTIPFFKSDLAAINECSVVVAVLNGFDVDSGTSWEIGYAYARSKIILGIYEDERIVNPLASLNLMLTSSVSIFNSQKLLRNRIDNVLSLSKNNGMSINQVNTYLDLIKNRIKEENLNLNLTTTSTFGYTNIVLCVIDSILSINRQYKTFVQPRVNKFGNDFKHINTLAKLSRLIDTTGIEKFGKDVLNYNDVKRMDLLKRFISRLETICNVEDKEFQCIKNWLIDKGPQGYKVLNVKGIALATFQYFRMLLGINTIKPDVHITKFIWDSLNNARGLNPEQIIQFLEAVANEMDTEPLKLDHAIWSKYSLKNQQSKLFD